jgi:hypothetical protein
MNKRDDNGNTAWPAPVIITGESLEKHFAFPLQVAANRLVRPNKLAAHVLLRTFKGAWLAVLLYRPLHHTNHER